MSAILQWLFPVDPIARTVLFGVVVLGGVAGGLGCFTLLRKRALAGDAIAHAVLPGICLAFLVTGEKSVLWLMSGAVVSGWLGLMAIDAITGRTRLKADVATGLVLSTFFGLGAVLLSVIQHSGAGNQSGLDRFVFGRAAAMTGADAGLIAVVAAVILIVGILFFRRFAVLSFDPDFAASIGLPRKWLSFVLALLTVAVVAIGIQVVGVVLMAALLVTPAAAARAWTNNLVVMACVAAVIGMVSGWLGAAISIAVRGMPTGPWIVLMASVLAGLSFLLAPVRGLLPRWVRSRTFQRKVADENMLKLLFSLRPETAPSGDGATEGRILGRSPDDAATLRSVLRRLRRRALIEPLTEVHWRLTDAGLQAAGRVVRLHRLWELYLNKRLGLPADHVHHSAEAIEHVLTPELEQLLSSDLGDPESDPHRQPIPRSGALQNPGT